MSRKRPANREELILWLAAYVEDHDVVLDRKLFLRMVAGRILDDVGLPHEKERTAR